METLSIDDSEIVVERSGHNRRDSTTLFYESEAFDSIWDALRWQHIRARVPSCLKRTVRSRYMLANLVYLVYAIGILIVDFNSTVNGSSTDNSTNLCDNSTASTPGLNQRTGNNSFVNHLYIGK